MAQELRHGLLNDPTFLSDLQSHYYSHYDLKRNTTSANPSHDDDEYKISDWKSTGNKKKTTMAALVLCLNLGIPPPDIVRPQEYPFLESFVNPSTYPDSKVALQAIGKSLQTNYESISARAKYKQSLDPSVEDLKRLCTSLRRNAKDERILFHYNGHGVPQPTHSGEIWVFNRGYTQYIPVSLYDLQNWLGAPYIMVIDTNAAGHVIENNKRFIQKRIDDEANHHADSAAPSPVSAYIESIQLGACQSNEILPLNADLPADLFTCCLTRPIEMSIKWFILFSPLREKGYYDILKNKNGSIDIPGKLTDRRTPLGELNWIFIAITDTIAWTTLSRPLFKRLFRQDLIIAALFRNFLLAKKIMPEVGCHPISDPPLPDISKHPMWDSWELAIDQILGQMLKKKKSEPDEEDMTDIPQLQVVNTENDGKAANGNTAKGNCIPNGNGSLPVQAAWNYQHCSFFQQHLTAFEVWLQYGSAIKEPPQQLPIVLQVLLSQAHRLRALHLLSNFLDLGPWAVYLALSVGMFPYIQKLLQSPSPDLKPILVFIWTRIMSVDYKDAQQELIKDRGYNYFTTMLTLQPRPSQPNLTGNPLIIESPAVNNDVTFADQKAMSAFVLAMFVRDHPQGRKLAFSIDVIRICIGYIESSESPLLRQWSTLFISEISKDHVEAVVLIMRSGLTAKLLQLLNDPIPEIRASLVDAFANLILLPAEADGLENSYGIKDELNQQDLKIATEVLSLCGDGSPLIRREVVCLFSRFVVKYIHFFLISAFSQLEEEITLLDNPSTIDEVRRRSPAYGSVFSTVWKALLIASEDPHDEVSNYSEQVVDFIMIKLRESQLGDIVVTMENYLLQKRSSGEARSNSNETLAVIGKVENPKLRSFAPTKKTNGNFVASARRVQSLNVDSKVKAELENAGKQPRSSASSAYGFSLTDKVSTFKSWLNAFGLYEDAGSEQSTSTGLTSLLVPQPTTLAYGTNYTPTTPRFTPRPKENGLPILPFSSGFLDYSCEYFQESQLGPKEEDEPGSEEYMRRIWRRNRNEAIIAATQPQKELALTGNWRNVVSKLNNITQPKILKFTQFEKWIATTDERDNITTFDWSKGVELSKMSNGNPFGTKITDLRFLNEDYVPLLMTGSSDGVVKIYKNFHDTESCQLLTAWRALTDIMLTPRSVGLLGEWQQSRGTLLVTGDVKVIKAWDAPREKCISDIPIRSTSQVLTLTSDQVSGNMVIAGFQDGSMRVYDRRLDSKDSMVKVYRPRNGLEKSPIRNVHMQRGGSRELISGSSNGLVQLWDIRRDDPIIKFKAFEKSMTAAFIHEHAPIIACASKEVDIYSTSGKRVAKIASGGFINTLNGTVRNNTLINSLALHPHRMMAATNHNQSAEINIYECREGGDNDDQFYSREELIGDYD